MADHDVHQAEGPRPLCDGARLVGRAVIYDNDFEWQQRLPPQRRDRWGQAGTAVEGGYDTLTERLRAGIFSLRLRAPNKANDSSDSV